jgi:hypothetical protein
VRYKWGMTRAHILVLTLLAAACDPRAKSAEVTAAGMTGATAPKNASKARESCASTSECDEGLRCVEQTCRSPQSTRLGEYYWTAGQVHMAKNKIPQAAEALQQALGVYTEEKLEVPAGLLCDFGAALRRKKGDARATEQAARLLHQCLLAAPSGSKEHAMALVELVELEPLGLNPKLLAGDKLADAYLLGPAKPEGPQEVVVTIEKSKPSPDKGYENFVIMAQGSEAKKALTPCYDKYFAAAQKPLLEIVVPLKMSVITGDDDLIVGGSLKLEGDAPAYSGAEAEAATCVKDALAPLAQAFAKDRASWSGSFRGGVTVKLAGPVE